MCCSPVLMINFCLFLDWITLLSLRLLYKMLEKKSILEHKIYIFHKRIVCASGIYLQTAQSFICVLSQYFMNPVRQCQDTGRRKKTLPYTGFIIN